FDTLLGMKIDEIGNRAGPRPSPRGDRARVTPTGVIMIDSLRRSKASIRGIDPEIVNFVPATQPGPRERPRFSFTHGRGNGRITRGWRGESLGIGSSAQPRRQSTSRI